MFPHQLTKDIQLQLLQKQHARELYQLTESNRDHLRRWLPWLDYTKEEKDTEAFIVGALQGFAETGAFACGVWHEKELCGVVGYNRIDWESKIAFPGYWLSKKAEGNGIMTQCCRALIEHAFDEYELNRVVINVATENHRSQSIPERLGFRREGILREAEWLYDHYVDHTVNALLKKEWEPNQTVQTTSASRRV